jgi:hypothetical protein
MRLHRFALAIALAPLALACEDKPQPAPASSGASASSAPPVAASAPPVATSAVAATQTATANAAPSEALPASVSYTPYRNTKYSYSVDVPSIFTSSTAFLGPAGQEWKWADKAIMNIAAGEAKGKTIKEWHDEAKKEPGVTGSETKDNWFFKTGKKGNKIFWQKSVLKADTLFTLRLEYNDDIKAFFDPIVAHVNKSLGVP